MLSISLGPGDVNALKRLAANDSSQGAKKLKVSLKVCLSLSVSNLKLAYGLFYLNRFPPRFDPSNHR